MTTFRVWLTGASLLFFACGSEPPPVKELAVARAFPTLPLPPNPELVSRSGSADALQLTVRSPADPAQVTDYYRTFLSRKGWRLVSDIRNPDGSTALYAEQDGPPLWVRIWKASDQTGTIVQLTGAVAQADTLKRDTARKERPTRGS